jgi:hypothetical protein
LVPFETLVAVTAGLNLPIAFSRAFGGFKFIRGYCYHQRRYIGPALTVTSS